MIDVMFYEVFKEEEALMRRYMPDSIKADFTSKTIQAHGTNEMPVGLISIRTQSRIPSEWAKKLKGILTRSAGYDHLGEYLKITKVDIACGYLPKYCARAVGEHSIMVAFSLMRKLKNQLGAFDAFHRDDLTGTELLNKTILIIGVGNIGMQIMDIAKGLKMDVIGVDIDHKTDEIPFVPLEKGLPRADVIICAVPLTDSTRNMLNYNVLRNIKRGAILVNIARGEITPTEDLKRLIAEGILGGVALDVYEEESRLADYMRAKAGKKDRTIETILELKEYENVIFTPHNAFNTAESVERKAQQSMEAISAFLKTNVFPNPIPKEQ